MRWILKNPGLVILVLAAIAFTAMTQTAWGTDWGECDHPRFVEHGCGEAGPPGPAGPQGEQGPPGEVPQEWITNVHNLYEESRAYMAAAAAMQVYLPQDQTSRLTFSGSRVGNTTGIGAGFAYMLDNDRNTSLTLAIGRAGSETTVSGSFGFEFGGQRKMQIPVFAPAPEPESEPVDAVIYEQRQQIENYHAEDIQVVQMAQVSLEYRIEALEQKPEPKPVIVKAPVLVPPEPEPRWTYEQKAAVYTALGIEENEGE